MLTPNTAQRLIPFRTLQNNQLSAAFTSMNETFWTENKVNGYYIIGYIINDKLDPLNKQIIPKVRQMKFKHISRQKNQNFFEVSAKTFNQKCTLPKKASNRIFIFGSM